MSYQTRAAIAHQNWVKHTKHANASIAGNRTSERRKQSLRKAIIDDSARYTELYNLVADWAWAQYQQGVVFQTISPRVPAARQAQALQDLAKNQGADWVKLLVVSHDQTGNLRNTGHLYNADWLIAHDLRWGVALLEQVFADMGKAGLFDKLEQI